MRVRWSDLVLLAGAPALPFAVAPLVGGSHWSLDLMACFPVQAMGWLGLCAILLAAARRWRAALAMAAGAAIAAAVVLPAWLRRPPPGPSDAVPMRVLALNLLRGSEANAGRALAVVAAAAPDLLFCSEVTPAWHAALADHLPQLPHRCVQTDDGYFGVALFSHWPLRAEVLPLPFAWAPAVRAVVATPAGDVGVLGVHAPRPGSRQRCRERDQALAAIPAALAPLPARRAVLGDCNATPWNAAFRALLDATGLRPAADGVWLPTWPTALPRPLRVPIDHVLVSGGIGVERCAVGADFGSDHLPVFAALRLPRTAPN
jgi:endonuclease/exonuclease/phosphatase (EEP) superfamily protein YafD